MAGFLVSVSVDMSRHRPTGTFEFSHEDLGPRTLPVLGTGEEDPAPAAQPFVSSTPSIDKSMPYSIDDLICALQNNRVEGADPHTLDMLYRLANPRGPAGGTECEAACTAAVQELMPMLNAEICPKDSLIGFCSVWLKLCVLPALSQLSEAAVPSRVKLVYDLAARVGTISHTPLRTLLAPPGESVSAFSHKAATPLHKRILQEKDFAALVKLAVHGTQATVDDIREVDLKKEEQIKQKIRRDVEEREARVQSEEVTDLLEQLTVLAATVTELENSLAEKQKQLIRWEEVTKQTNAQNDANQETFIDELTQYNRSFFEKTRLFVNLIIPEDADDETRKPILDALKESGLLEYYSSETPPQSPQPREIKRPIFRNDDEWETTSGEGPLLMVAHMGPTKRVNDIFTTRTRALSNRIGVMVLGWERSWETEGENMVSSLARHCFAEASAMSPFIAQQGPKGWLSIIDPRCPVVTQFDTLIAHYLNATRRASGNRPGYDKDYRRHAGAYRQQLCFFRSVKRGPQNSSCKCSETTGWICIYPANANLHPGSPACTTPILGV